MCCGNKRSAWRSAPASTPQPRAAPTPVLLKPPVDAREAAVLPPKPKFRLSALQQEPPSARPARIWRLTS